MKVKRKKITIKQRREALAKANAAKAELTWAAMLGLPVMQRAQRYQAAYWRHFNMIGDGAYRHIGAGKPETKGAK